MDLFSLIRAPGAAQAKVGSRQRVAHEVALLTATATRTVDMVAPPATSESTETPTTTTKSPADHEGDEEQTLETTAAVSQLETEAANIVHVDSSAEADPTIPDPPVLKKRRKLARGSGEENVSKIQKTGPSIVFSEHPIDKGPFMDIPDVDLQFSNPTPISFVQPQPQPDLNLAQ